MKDEIKHNGIKGVCIFVLFTPVLVAAIPLFTISLGLDIFNDYKKRLL